MPECSEAGQMALLTGLQIAYLTPECAPAHPHTGPPYLGGWAARAGLCSGEGH